MEVQQPYSPKNKIRIVSAASLFDGHDAAINIMRRIIQRTGCEVIHLGHDRSVDEVVTTAIQEDAQAIAMTSYQGGHNEYFKYMKDLLEERGAGHIKIFGGGGGTILPEEISALQDYGIERIYHPDDGREMGLQGMINDLVERADFETVPSMADLDGALERLGDRNIRDIARSITAAENDAVAFSKEFAKIYPTLPEVPVLGITGTGGSGKSSMVDELVRRFLADFPDKRIALVSVDPSKRKTGGALLGDRIRMNSIHNERVYMRSLATRQSNLALSKHVSEALNVLRAAEFDLIILETSGIGQSDTEIMEHSDVALYIMTPEFGAATQLEKIDMLDFADVVAINKSDKRGALDALRDVRKQFKRNHDLWEAKDDDLPVIGTIASQFNDPGTNVLYASLMSKLTEKTKADLKPGNVNEGFGVVSEKVFIIPPSRVRYLSEIAESNRSYDKWAERQASVAGRLEALLKSTGEFNDNEVVRAEIEEKANEVKLELDAKMLAWLEDWPSLKARYNDEVFSFEVRGKEIRIPTKRNSLSNRSISKVALPTYTGWSDLVKYATQENLPGSFPYTAGIYPFKRQGEDPTRMFAGEGGPERTNKRFHYVSLGTPAKRLSTAFDSVTLYGNDPDVRPDIYGKVGNAGVSICCLDDAKKLYSGFDLCSPTTSVSMTINGPAPMVLAFFLNAAIDQTCEKFITENGLESEVEKVLKLKWDDCGLNRPHYEGDLPEGNDGLGLMLLGCTGDEILDEKTYARLKIQALTSVRGTVQADILKEDQAQNTCIFSTEFALRLMGDVQQYFIDEKVRNFYSVSISGYHIAEAGANPITQLAFTLANGFTYVEYYLSRGMDINDFGPNLSFFFSNGVDPEYAVIGRVARKIWAKAMREKYAASPRAQMLKYHIQTSGRSLHAQEIDFNDIRTTLQALYAIYDNCNSLHTNAYDEAITTPTEESVRRAMAIQLIINKELGLAMNENPMQGSFIMDEITELVEEAVLTEFDRITERGGVLGAMETMYQRSRIQEESLHYETLKHSGEYEIIGVNTFLSKDGSPTIIPGEVIRATENEKQVQLRNLGELHKAMTDLSESAILKVQEAAVTGGNLFEELMETSKVASLGQITNAMFKVGGAYRRNM
ncbi:MAG TPA: methylmalonyl-CoA mutase [Flavobacteriales bacterium]|jgi:methylmalonyl-CoA mutase|nr:methylmalonyl-CoA mutase [Flavobacteriales bacterium]HIB77810.1 methylmalonyl-CoA mutase [Flavobacteriales bacterium]HIN41372.1 methylmalonyl-CoA mutase [Flavobacteriales bacterium]HIO60127.1 methylmalonyl-CoA mutase [Flavobacteriales bacterium]